MLLGEAGTSSRNSCSFLHALDLGNRYTDDQFLALSRRNSIVSSRMPFVRHGRVVDNALAVRDLILEQEYSRKAYDALSDQERTDFHKQIPRYLQAILRNDRLREITSPLAQNNDLYQQAVKATVKSFQGRDEPIRDLIGPGLAEAFSHYLRENLNRSIEKTPCEGCEGRIDSNSDWDRCADCEPLLCHSCMRALCKVRGKEHRYQRFEQNPRVQRRQQIEMARAIAPLVAKTP